MLATADCTNHYVEQIAYESEWTENIPTGISWLNLLTAQPIPEETDVLENSHSPVRNKSESTCSSTSVESCYVVLEIQRPRSGDEASSKIEDEVDEIEEDEEEIEEEIEELNFAQINQDHDKVHHDQMARSMTIEMPTEEYVVEYQQEEVLPAENYAQATEAVVLETPNDILFHKAKTLSRFTKRMKAMSYLANKEQLIATSSDEESLKANKQKLIRKINEYHPTAILAAAIPEQRSRSPCHSTTSIDSIDSKPLSSPPVRVTTTFSNLSTQRALNPVQNQRSGPTMGTTTLTRTFAFDRACMEKYGRTSEKKEEPIEIEIKSLDKEPIKKEEVVLAEKSLETNEQTESTPNLTDQLHCRSFTNTISPSFYIGSDRSTIDDSETDHRPSIPPISASNSLSKTSSILSSMKKCARTIKTEYCSSNQNNIFQEPTLLQVKYLDGRLPLRDDQARESFRQSQTISGSFANRLNRLGLTKMSSTQDLSQTTFHMSYRKRMLNRFRAFVENNTFDPPSCPPDSSSSSQMRPWQHKTITELFNERKSKSNHQY